MASTVITSQTGAESILLTNKMIRNTYMLLSMTLFFSAVTAGLGMILHVPMFPWWLNLIAFLGLIFLTKALQETAWGLLAVFLLTGYIGLTIGPILNLYLHLYSNGSQLIMMAMGGTSAIFLGLSGYAMTTRRDFSFLGGFLAVGLIVLILAGIGALVFNLTALSLAVSAVSILIFSAYILYDTSQIIHGGETNYISATVSLYLDIINIFLSLLRLLGVFAGERD